MIFLITSIAALGIFLYGIDLINAGLSKLFSEQIKRFLSVASKSVLWAIIIGTVVTVLIQNSNTPVVMLMGFATSRLIDLKGAMGIILGADIGSTLTVQLISFNLYELGLVLIASGFLIGVFARDSKVKAVSGFLTGLGFILFSMDMLNGILAGVRSRDGGLLVLVLHDPYLSFTVSLLLTSVVQSSAATIGIAISLANAGLIGLNGAMPIILGANIGTCSTALFAMSRADQAGRRVAIIHLLFKVAGVVVVVVLFKPFIQLISFTASGVAHQIANAHTLFNVLITLIFAPFASTAARFFEAHIKTGRELSLPDRPQFLDESVVTTPPIAFHYALKEIVRLGEYVYRMFEISYTSIAHNVLWSINELDAMNGAVERLASAIKLYLVRVSASKGLTEEFAAQQFELVRYLKNFEVISDIICQNMSSEIEKKTIEQHRLSEEGWAEIRHYYQEVMTFYREVMTVIESGSRDTTIVAAKRGELSRAELVLLKHHLERLNKGYRESLETSALHIEIVSNLRRIVSQLSSMIETMSP